MPFLYLSVLISALNDFHIQQPKIGGEVVPHQANSFLYTNPIEVKASSLVVIHGDMMNQKYSVVCSDL